MSFIIDLISMLKDVFAAKPDGSNLEQTAAIIPKVSNRPMPKKLLQCKPELQQLAIQFLDACEAKGIAVVITYGIRTYQEQAELYAKGRDAKGNVVNKKLIVTNAKPGTSLHETGTAFDCAFLHNGKLDWAWLDQKEQAPIWEQIGQIGESLGLVWGGRFKSICDRPHFQLPSE